MIINETNLEVADNSGLEEFNVLRLLVVLKEDLPV